MLDIFVIRRPLQTDTYIDEFVEIFLRLSIKTVQVHLIIRTTSHRYDQIAERLWSLWQMLSPSNNSWNEIMYITQMTIISCKTYSTTGGGGGGGTLTDIGYTGGCAAQQGQVFRVRTPKLGIFSALDSRIGYNFCLETLKMNRNIALYPS